MAPRNVAKFHKNRVPPSLALRDSERKRSLGRMARHHVAGEHRDRKK